MDVCLLWVLCVLSGRGFCDELITRPEDSYRLWCVVVCDLETSWMRRPSPLGAVAPKTNKQTNDCVVGCGNLVTAYPTTCQRLVCISEFLFFTFFPKRSGRKSQVDLGDPSSLLIQFKTHWNFNRIICFHLWVIATRERPIHPLLLHVTSQLHWICTPGLPTLFKDGSMW